MTTYIGIDPGPTYTGFCVIKNGKLVYSTTFKREDKEIPIFWWANHVADQIENIVAQFPGAKIGVEGVVTPQAYFAGKKNLMNPKHLIFTGVIAGTIAGRFHKAVIVRPGKNGSGANYPPELTGTRPKDLPGKAVGTRNHERSAYDVANQIELHLKEEYQYDRQMGMFD